MFWNAVGLTAACLTAFAFIPQTIKIIKTKSAKDVSLATLIQFLIGVSCWAAYGIHLKDAIIILANIVTLINLAIVLILCSIYGRVKS